VIAGYCKYYSDHTCCKRYKWYAVIKLKELCNLLYTEIMARRLEIVDANSREYRRYNAVGTKTMLRDVWMARDARKSRV